MRVAALDLGSNTFLMLIADVEEGNGCRLKRIVGDFNRVTRLSEGVNQTKTLSPQSLERARQCFADYQEKYKEHSVDLVVAVATSAARDAKNGDEFYELAKEFGIPVKIISGQQEAKLTFLGATCDLESINESIVIDIGGGSTEILGCSQGGEVLGKSLDVGSVRLTEMFGEDVDSLDQYINKLLEENKGKMPNFENGKLIAVAGTPTTLAALDMNKEFQANEVEGYVLSLIGLERWRNKLLAMSNDERLALPGMQKGREDVIVAGLSILTNTMKFLSLGHVAVSTKGLRYGLALNYREYSS